MTPTETWVWLARILRTQGRKGEVFAEILTDFREKFADRKELWLVADPVSVPPREPRAVQLLSHWPHKGGIVLHFAGVDTISDAEKLAGLGIAIPLSQRAPLAPDEAYLGDLIGCTLVDLTPVEPVPVGRIEDVDFSAGPAPLLIVRGAAGEVLVPYARDYLRRLDLEGRRVEMVLPEGLVDLNR